MDQHTDSGTYRSVGNTGRTRSVLLRRTFPATVDQLWATCTQPDTLARWYGTVTGDTRLGGSVELLEVAATCEILRCEAPYRLDLTWADSNGTTVVRLSLRRVDDGTELTLEQLGFLAPVAAAGHGSGWERELGRLEMFLAGGAKADGDAMSATAPDALWDDLPEEYDVRWGRADGADSVTIVRDLDVDRQTVWAAVSTDAGLGAWFGTVTGSLAEGGDWAVAFDDGTASGTIEDCAPGLGFRTTYRQGIDGPDDVQHVEISLSEMAAATRLTLVHTFTTGASPRLRTGMTAGWNAYLGALVASVSGREVTDADWMADFRIALVALG